MDDSSAALALDEPARLQQLSARLSAGARRARPVDLPTVVEQRKRALADALAKADEKDKRRDRERIRDAHRQERERERAEARSVGGYTLGVPLAADDDVKEASDDSEDEEDEAEEEEVQEEQAPVPAMDLESAALALLAKKRRV